jgi:hypothetical protein
LLLNTCLIIDGWCRLIHPYKLVFEKGNGMVTPHQRLARMRKSFAKNKSVLTKDYNYFITPDITIKPRVSIPRNKAAHMSAERSAPKFPK